MRGESCLDETTNAGPEGLLAVYLVTQLFSQSLDHYVTSIWMC